VPDPTRGASHDPPAPTPPARRSDWVQAADDVAADMYLDGLARLDAAGYEQYEISNVARAGRASRGWACRGWACRPCC